MGLWLGRGCYFFLIYSSILFFGTAPLVLALQGLALVGAGLTIVSVAIRQRVVFLPQAFLLFLLLFLMFLMICVMLSLTSGQTPTPIMLRFAQVFLLTLAVPVFACGFDRLGVVSCAQSVKHVVLSLVAYALAKIAIFVAVGITNISTQQSDGLETAIHARQRIERDLVVRAVGAAGDDHRPLQSERPMHLEIVIESAVGSGIIVPVR